MERGPRINERWPLGTGTPQQCHPAGRAQQGASGVGVELSGPRGRGGGSGEQGGVTRGAVCRSRRARVAVLAPFPAPARASARLPGPPGGAAGPPASRPDAPRPGSQWHFDDMFGVSLRVGARGAAGKGRGSPTGSGVGWAGEAEVEGEAEGKGGGRAGPRGAGSGAARAATRQAWRRGKRGPAALVRSRPGAGGAGRGAGLGGLGAGLGEGAIARASGCK